MRPRGTKPAGEAEVQAASGMHAPQDPRGMVKAELLEVQSRLATSDGRPHGEGGQVTLIPKNEEVRAMRNAETVLGIIQDRGKRGLVLEDVYRQLFNPSLYLRAYGRIYRNDGALTRGATAETVDGMSQEKIVAIIEQLRHERYRWTPVRR